MIRIGHRLARLEREAGSRHAPSPCARCGGPTDWRLRRLDPAQDRIIVRGVRPNEPPIEGPDECPSCGRPLVIRVTLDRGG
jgi:hypothetical protein